MPEYDPGFKGGTMRLGMRTTLISENTLASKLHNNQSTVDERHRHRYEVNPLYIEQL